MEHTYNFYLALDLLHEIQEIEMNMAYDLTLLPTYVHNNDFRQIAAMFKTFETDETYIQNIDISLFAYLPDHMLLISSDILHSINSFI
jgi:hypothetical protein